MLVCLSASQWMQVKKVWNPAAYQTSRSVHCPSVLELDLTAQILNEENKTHPLGFTVQSSILWKMMAFSGKFEITDSEFCCCKHICVTSGGSKKSIWAQNPSRSEASLHQLTDLHHWCIKPLCISAWCQRKPSYLDNMWGAVTKCHSRSREPNRIPDRGRGWNTINWTEAAPGWFLRPSSYSYSGVSGGRFLRLEPWRVEYESDTSVCDTSFIAAL